MTAQPRDIVAARAVVWEDSGCSLMARVLGNSAVAITQATISSIALSIFNMTDDPTTASDTATPVVADTVFDTYQTDARWTEDDTGYNFRYTATAAQLALGGKLYRYEFKLTPSSGEAFHIVFEIETADLRRS